MKKEQRLFKVELFCNIINHFTVAFDHLLKKVLLII